MSRDKNFKVLVASRGAEALALAREYHPTAISLDVFLPDMLGWTVLNHLKQDSSTRHIPVQMLTMDEDRHHGLARGAFSFVTKPTTTEGLETALEKIKTYSAPRRRRLLVVEDNPAEQLSIRELLNHTDIDVTVAETGKEALNTVNEHNFDCVVLDLRLPDMSGFDVLEQIGNSPTLSDLPVVVFTGKELSSEEDARLHTLARSVVVKDVESPERLLDETALFLHRVVADLPPEKQRMLEKLHRSDEALVGKKVLVVDDDVRNIFALSSVLERRGMTVLTAGTGREAIQTLGVHQRCRHRFDGHHDAGNGRLRNHAGDPAKRRVTTPADHRAHRQSYERRPRKMSGSGGLGISCQAREYRSAASACVCGCTARRNIRHRDRNR